MPAPILRNDHNVYILGAGASADAGLPLIATFLSRMRDSLEWLIAQGRTKESDSINRVLAFRQEAAGAAYRTRIDVDNVEELFSLASADEAALRNDMASAIAATLDYCRSTTVGSVPEIELSLKTAHLPSSSLSATRWTSTLKPTFDPLSTYFTMPSHDYYPAVMAGRAGPVRPVAHNTFITFNYDLVIESALAQCGLTVDYGIPSTSLLHRAKWLSRSSGVPVLKIHGSVNWAFPGHRGGKMTAFEDYASVVANNLTPVLVPPTWKKNIAADQLSYVWDAAVAALSEATRIVIVGFSLPPNDLHFKYLLGWPSTEHFAPAHHICRPTD